MKHFPPSDPHLVALCFNRERLTSARELKGYTKAHLASLIQKTPSAITQFEAGVIQPDAKTVAGLSLALGMPTQYFARTSESHQISMEECHFRSLRSASQLQRRQSIRMGELAHEVVCFLEDEGVVLPQEQVTKLKEEIEFSADFESIALRVRNIWGLGAGPILEPIKLLESKGILVLPLPNSCREVDAFSTWINGRPVIMLAMHKSSSRTHFDVSHELAHLILHDDVKAGDPVCEKEADSFASAFLLPNISFLRECPRTWNINEFLALKKRWHVSIRALLYKAHKNDYLSVSSYRRANIDLNSRYGAASEPGEWDLVKPTVLRQAINIAEKEGISLDHISHAIGISQKNLLDIVRALEVD